MLNYVHGINQNIQFWKILNVTLESWLVANLKAVCLG